MPFGLALAVLACIGLAMSGTDARAQLLPQGVLPGQGAASSDPAAGTPSQDAAPDAAGAATSTAEHARALVGILEDEAARTRLIGELQAIADRDGAPAGELASDDAAPGETAEKPLRIGDRITALVPALLRDVVHDAQDIWEEMRATARGLGTFSQLDTSELRKILVGVVPVALIATLVSIIARRLMIPVFRRMGADRTRMIRTALVALAALVLDLATVLAGAAAGFVVIVVTGVEDETRTSFEIVFLAAYVIAGALLVALRAILSPASPSLRPLPLDDAGARYWSNRLGFVLIALSFGEVFLRGLISQTVSPAAAQATLVVVYSLVGFYLVGLILANRHAPSAYFERRAAENDEDLTFSIIAGIVHYWHYVAIAFLVALMHQVLTSGDAVLPLIFAATEILVAFVVGAFVVTIITRISERGAQLPDRLKRALPAMEARINAFIPSFLRLFRLVVLALWFAFTLQVVGLLEFRAWLEQRAGVDVIGAAASILLIVLVGFLAWLALSSWVDYRLVPSRGRAPTARERTLLVLLRNAATVVILVLGLMFTLSELGISIAPLIASAGVLGLAIGFGAQKMVEDIIGGVFIQLENAANVGDVVEAAGITGVVEQLTIRSVGLRDLHGVYHVIPFSAVSTVSNLTRGFGHHVADIGIAYRESIDEAKAEMLAAYDDLRADAELGPKLIGDLEWFGVESLGDSSVVLRARLKTWPGEQWTLGRAYNEQVKKRFDAAGIEIPFPHMTMWFGETKDGSAPAANLAIRSRARRQRRAAGPDARTPTRQENQIRSGSPTDAEAHHDEGSGDGPGDD